MSPIESTSYPKHFLGIEGLPKQALLDILCTAQTYLSQGSQKLSLLSGKSIANLFYESSTRTRTTFEIAAKRLGADVTNFNIAVSSTSKGETLLDTLWNLQAMNIDMFIVRHNSSGAAAFIAQHLKNDAAVLNAGDGQHEHPTQAMLDMFTILHYKKQFSGLKVAIVGDILHSRVARSQIHALSILGVEDIRVVAPKTLLPAHCDTLGVQVFYDLHRGLKDVDVIVMLRLQNERMQHGLLPSKMEFYHTYGLTPERLAYAKPDALVMHPGPINRGVEIASSVADGAQSVILKQVHFGIPVRMAVISLIMGITPTVEKDKQ